ncbi:MAG: DUF4190 domain-containing protein [Mycobacterium sp.]|jgi:hypothetical protein|nr:DUF4190 domain-containing protein [Mycobacterium sp.]MCX6479786.1 DUF4190 domain-containing protein [Mycobacterium sp.]
MTAGGGAPRETGPDDGDRPSDHAPPPELGAPYLGGYGYPARKDGTNPLAIFALVSSVLGVVSVGLVGGVGSALGIVLGAVALTQIKRSPQGGRGPALAAIVVGLATLLVSFVLRAFALSI